MDSSNKVPTNRDEDVFCEDGGPLTPVFSDTFTQTRIQPPTRRTISTHSLLAINGGTDLRRGSKPDITTSATGRANISMPPPLGKPSNDRRLSASIATIAGRQFRRSEDGNSSSVVATSPPSSVKSFDDRQQFVTSPPTSTTATDTTSVTTNSVNQLPGVPFLSPPLNSSTMPEDLSAALQQSFKPAAPNESVSQAQLSRAESTAAAGPALITQSRVDEVKNDSALPARAPRVPTPRSASHTRRLSRTTSKENSVDEARPIVGTIGVCALDVKARSRPSRQILTRLQSDDEFEVIIFGDKVIQDEGI